MWKSACVGVYQLLNWKIHGETLKYVILFRIGVVNAVTSSTVLFPNSELPNTILLFFLEPCKQYPW